MRTETMNYAAPPRIRKEMRSLVDRVIKKASAMSPNELFGTLVRAGIHTKNGKLRKAYGG
jgi:hypothetical protein